MHPAPELDALRLFGALESAGVDFIVVGGIAAVLHGSPSLTDDVDICYARDETNLEALAAVLRSLNARLRGAEARVPFRADARTLRNGDSFTFTTDLGDLDILGTPSGTGGYADLVRTAERVELDGLTILAASIDDLIRMKRAAGRRKDLIEVEVLAALREEIDAGR